MYQTGPSDVIDRLTRLISEALEIADQHKLLDVGICLDGALVRLSAEYRSAQSSEGALRIFEQGSD
jgi:hypothetical protein